MDTFRTFKVYAPYSNPTAKMPVVSLQHETAAPKMRRDKQGSTTLPALKTGPRSSYKHS